MEKGGSNKRDRVREGGRQNKAHPLNGGERLCLSPLVLLVSETLMGLFLAHFTICLCVVIPRNPFRIPDRHRRERRGEAILPFDGAVETQH